MLSKLKTTRNKKINEDASNASWNTIYKLIKDEFSVTMTPPKGSSYILPTGEFLNLEKWWKEFDGTEENEHDDNERDDLYKGISNDDVDWKRVAPSGFPTHSLVQYFIDTKLNVVNKQVNTINRLDDDDDTLMQNGCIKLNSGETLYDNLYINLPEKRPTNQALESLDEYIFTQFFKEDKDMLRVYVYNNSWTATRYKREDYPETKEIIKKITKYYSTGKLDESKENNKHYTIDELREICYKEVFDITDTPRNGICYLRDDGKFIYYKDNMDPNSDEDNKYAPIHGCENEWLRDRGYTMTKSPFSNFYPNLNDGYIRSEEHRIDLINLNNLTPSQYDSLRLWIDHVQASGYVDKLVVMSSLGGKQSYVKYKFKDDIDSKYIVNRIKRFYATGELLENFKLKEEYVDEDRFVYTTDSAYEMASRVKSSTESLRILWDRNIKRFFVCFAEELIHRDMVEKALEAGYYGNMKSWQLDGYMDDFGKNVIYYIYAPKGKEKDTYGSDISEDGYEGKYVYEFGTMTTRSDDKYKASPLAKALGKYKEHYIQDGWIDDYKPKLKLVDSLNKEEKDNEGNILSLEQVEFFKDSKIRNRDGKLIVMYHASNVDFDSFDKKYIGSGNGGANFGTGFYFTPNKEYASEYGKVKAYYLNLKNPFIYSAYGSIKRGIALMKKSGFEIDDDEIEEIISDKYAEDNYDLLDIIWDNNYSSDDFSRCLFNNGYDGIDVGEEIIVFSENAIKLIDNKSPTNSNKINEETDSVDGNTIRVYTYQSSAVVRKLKNNKVYIAKPEKGMFQDYGEYNPYLSLIKVLGLKGGPIFGALSIDMLDQMMEASELEDSDRNKLLTLNVPKNEVKLTEYYDWTDYIYALDDPIGFEKSGGISLSELENLLRDQRSESSYEVPQVVIDKIKPEWIVSNINESIDIKNSAIEKAISFFGTTTEPELTAMFILPNGKFMFTSPLNDDEDFYYEYDEHKNVGEYIKQIDKEGNYDDYSDAYSIMQELGAIRYNMFDGYISYVILSKKSPTEQQYASLLKLFDKVINNKFFGDVKLEKWDATQSLRIELRTDDIIAEDLIKIIRRYYSSGILRESLEEDVDNTTPVSYYDEFSTIIDKWHNGEISDNEYRIQMQKLRDRKKEKEVVDDEERIIKTTKNFYRFEVDKMGSFFQSMNDVMSKYIDKDGNLIKKYRDTEIGDAISSLRLSLSNIEEYLDVPDVDFISDKLKNNRYRSAFSEKGYKKFKRDLDIIKTDLETLGYKLNKYKVNPKTTVYEDDLQIVYTSGDVTKLEKMNIRK